MGEDARTFFTTEDRCQRHVVELPRCLVRCHEPRSRHCGRPSCRSAVEVERWPLPGQGSTNRRLELLASCSATDLVLGRLVEAHADALAILSELGANVEPASRILASNAVGVSGRLVHPKASWRPAGVNGWRISGTKNWCSGAGLVTHALVDASCGDGQRLFEVDLSDPGVTLARPDWAGPGMKRADTRRRGIPECAGATAIGEPGRYLSRPGFWAGAVGVAACWHGGTVRGGRSIARFS